MIFWGFNGEFRCKRFMQLFVQQDLLTPKDGHHLGLYLRILGIFPNIVNLWRSFGTVINFINQNRLLQQLQSRFSSFVKLHIFIFYYVQPNSMNCLLPITQFRITSEVEVFDALMTRPTRPNSQPIKYYVIACITRAPNKNPAPLSFPPLPHTQSYVRVYINK